MNNFKFKILNFKNKDEGPVPHLKTESIRIAEGSRSLSAGFTLVEMIISIFIFSIIAIITTGIFARAVQLQRGSFDAQRIVENSLFLLEAMSRDIRVSQICPSTSPCTTNSLYITHPLKGTMRYYLDSARGVVVKTEGGSTVDVTSSDVNFTRFNFLTTGLGVDNRQPKVVVVISVQNRSGLVKFNLQTAVTTRDISEEFQN